MTYLLIHADGRKERVESENILTLGELQKLVGGYIEWVPLARDGFGCMVNEEGRIMDPPLPDNAKFPEFCGPIVFGRMAPGPNEEDGDDFTGLTPAALAKLEAI